MYRIELSGYSWQQSWRRAGQSARERTGRRRGSCRMNWRAASSRPRRAGGALGFNTAVQPAGRPAAELRIGDRTYRRGLGHHAPGEIVVDLGGQFQLFQADLGIQWQGGRTTGSVVFQVYVDDKKVFDSGIVHETAAPRTIAVPVVDAQEMRLVVTDAGDGITCDCADWADARLTRNPVARPSAAQVVNVAPFGRIMSWDPAKQTGTTASRVGEFPREDIEPGREITPAADGQLAVPNWNGRGCLGVQWYESRTLRQVELEFADPDRMPSPQSIKLETWAGESAWQGQWVAAKASCTKDGNRMSWLLEGSEAARPTPKVQWHWVQGKKRPIRVKSVSAFTRSRWKPVDLEITSLDGRSLAQLPIDLYNGAFETCASESSGSLTMRIWRVCPVRTKPTGPSCDSLFRSRGLVSRSRMYWNVEPSRIRESACPPSRGPSKQHRSPRPARCCRRFANGPTRPWTRRLAVVHKPIQDLGPMMLSLACDNRKVVAERDGTLDFDVCRGIDDPPRPFPDQWRLEVHAGSGTDLKATPPLARRLASHARDQRTRGLGRLPANNLRGPGR